MRWRLRRTRPWYRGPSRQRRNSGIARLIELLFFAYRDFTGDADALLLEYGFGRAHHRVLHFVNRKPGLTVAELLDILKITKQSLARVLKELIDHGYIFQVHGAKDRRQRELYPSQKGPRSALNRLPVPQTGRISQRIGRNRARERQIIEDFLKAMVRPGAAGADQRQQWSRRMADAAAERPQPDDDAAHLAGGR